MEEQNIRLQVIMELQDLLDDWMESLACWKEIDKAVSERTSDIKMTPTQT